MITWAAQTSANVCECKWTVGYSRAIEPLGFYGFGTWIGRWLIQIAISSSAVLLRYEEVLSFEI